MPGAPAALTTWHLLHSPSSLLLSCARAPCSMKRVTPAAGGAPCSGPGLCPALQDGAWPDRVEDRAACSGWGVPAGGDESQGLCPYWVRSPAPAAAVSSLVASCLTSSLSGEAATSLLGREQSPPLPLCPAATARTQPWAGSEAAAPC